MKIQYEEIKEKKIISLKDMGENDILVTIKIVDIQKFKSCIKKALQLCEKAFYNYGKDWVSFFVELSKKIDLGFKVVKLNKKINFCLIQEIAPHYEFL